MKLSAAREAYYTHSAKVSDQARAFAFAGIAVVWIFKSGESTSTTIDQKFIGPLALFCAGLLADFLQYLGATIAWGAFHRLREVELADVNADPEIVAPFWINYPAILFFWVKLVLVGIGAIWLVKLVAALWLK